MWKLKEHVLIVFGRRWEDSPSNELHTLYWLCGCITSQVIRLMTHIQDIWILVTSNHGLMTSAWAYIMICVAVCQLEVVFQDSESLETLRELWKVIKDSLSLSWTPMCDDRAPASLIYCSSSCSHCQAIAYSRILLEYARKSRKVSWNMEEVTTQYAWAASRWGLDCRIV